MKIMNSLHKSAQESLQSKKINEEKFSTCTHQKETTLDSSCLVTAAAAHCVCAEAGSSSPPQMFPVSMLSSNGLSPQFAELLGIIMPQWKNDLRNHISSPFLLDLL